MQNDVAYANADFIPDAAAYPDRWAEQARGHREIEHALGRARLNHAYGDHPRQRLDVFHPAGQAEGLVAFFHGGYWLRFDRSYWSHLARGATARGWAVAMPSYRLAPEAGLPEIAQDAAAALTEAARLVRGPIRLSGHSAGGQLVMRLAGGELAPGCRDRVVRVLPISPVADLRPLIETSMNADLRLDAEVARAESPALHPAPDVPVTIWVGAEERPAFLDQARLAAEAWRCGLRIAPGRHHFDVIEELEDPESPLIAALLA